MPGLGMGSHDPDSTVRASFPSTINGCCLSSQEPVSSEQPEGEGTRAHSAPQCVIRTGKVPG